MNRSVIGLAVLAIMATCACAVFAGNECGKPSAKAAASSACGPSGKASTVACESPRGKVAGNFDPSMSSACRFACATKLKYEPKDVQAQPGAIAGKLTQCPVSGVVFAVDASRPHVRFAKEDYVTCCDKCAQKLRANPRHYLKA